MNSASASKRNVLFVGLGMFWLREVSSQQRLSAACLPLKSPKLEVLILRPDKQKTAVVKCDLWNYSLTSLLPKSRPGPFALLVKKRELYHQTTHFFAFYLFFQASVVEEHRFIVPAQMEVGVTRVTALILLFKTTTLFSHY